MNTVTLCMIVKDEAELLPDCLRSVQGAVDQVIVVDTGSTDGTPALAARAGATVLHHRWTDDFAAARNAALPHVRGSYVLMLDADERLAPGTARQVRAFARAAVADAGLLPLHNARAVDAPAEAILSGAARKGDVVWLPRLFRHSPDFRWEGRIHESPKTWSLVPGRTVARCAAPILHLGYADSLWEARDKGARNEALLRAAHTDEPDNLDTLAYLAEAQAVQGKAAEARATWALAVQALDQLPAAERRRPVVLFAASEGGLALLQAGRAPKVQALIRTLRSWGWSHANLDFLEARATEETARGAEDEVPQLQHAATLYARALLPPVEADVAKPLPGVRGASTLARLAEVEAKLGDLPAAWQHAQTALRQGSVPARLLAAELLLADGQPQQALTVVEPGLSPHSPDGWVLAAAAALNLGAPEDSSRFLGMADQLAGRAWVAPRRRALYLDLSEKLAQPA